MNLISIITYIIGSAIFLFIFFPIALFLAYLFFDLYNKLYLKLVGQGNRWYQNLFIFPAGLFSLRNKRYIKKNLTNGNLKDHIAIVLANNYFPENVHGFGLDCVIDLMKYLNKNNKSYRVYNKITSQKLKKVINDKRVSSIFLFGHGQRHGVKIGRDEVVYYCEFQNHPKKHLIAQFHCNHLKGKSLADYGEKPIYTFILDKVQRQGDINRQLKEIIKRGLI